MVISASVNFPRTHFLVRVMNNNRLSNTISIVQQVYGYFRRHGLGRTLRQIVIRLWREVYGWATMPFFLKSLPCDNPNTRTWYDADNPEVSIIVLNFNKARMTLECLAALWRHTTGYRYEIVLVDNGSSAGDLRVLRQASVNVRLVSLEENRYFGEGNNIGVEASKGEFVALLNNDVLVQDRWLEILMARLLDSDKAGGVGPRFIYPDGRLQEAGAFIGADGRAQQRGKLGDPWSDEFSQPCKVDYVSAATFLLRRKVFESVLGFDLAFDPAYYEDADLCFKIRSLGYDIWYEPGTTVVHHESVTSSDPRHGLKLGNIVDLNRQKFMTKWAHCIQKEIFPRTQIAFTGFSKPPDFARRNVGLFTPYALTPGGGERYLLSIAQALSPEFEVFLVTPERWSRMRILTLGRELGLTLNDIRLLSLSELGDRRFDVFVAMGNSILPPTPPLGRTNIFQCQFPFPTLASRISPGYQWWAGYDCVFAYSSFALFHCQEAMNAHSLESKPMQIVHPPVALLEGNVAKKKRPSIVHIGRFFSGGHCKRQDILIEAFKKLTSLIGSDTELHLVGSVHPEPDHRDYLLQCMDLAKGLAVHFHLNASRAELNDLLAEASVYWHGTGFGLADGESPFKCEHFGISLVEAMSAGCIPFAVRNGGPCEFIEHGKSGFLYSTTDELAHLTGDVLVRMNSEEAGTMRQNAVTTARRFSDQVFAETWRNALRAVDPMGKAD